MTISYDDELTGLESSFQGFDFDEAVGSETGLDGDKHELAAALQLNSRFAIGRQG